ncbi:Calcineurin-like phosphoesterase [Trujillonella endophytica]|uniref:Calcineurin-like phosphoesterase n=1 Tax=Trujillonella endophytica TaxID=673521 RepID=A0A1H8PD94_9ACTN|nr:Calcineurin-like phosphoesterase [Trujillella endophytica]
MQLIGDVQTDWERIWPLSGRTTYDAIGRDVRDHLIHDAPAARFQMGDISDGDAGGDPAVLRRRFALFDAWCGSYRLAVYKVMGNHDVPYDAVTPRQWAAVWGYPAPSYTVDLGDVNAVVLGPSAPHTASPLGEPPCPGWPVRPLTAADIAWLDRTLAADTRPTLVLNHAPLASEPTVFGSGWQDNQSTMRSRHAPDLVELLAGHRHVVAWAHGHTHTPWDRGTTGLMTIGGRRIARIDAAATYTQPTGAPPEVGVGRAVTFYVTVLDDGRTVDVRWRDHAAQVWTGAPDVGRLHRLVTS